MPDNSDSSLDDDCFVDAVDTPPYALHRAVFERRPVEEIGELLRAEDVAQKDVHGNTPLHLAVMTGQRDVISLLLHNNAPVKSKNLQGWTPLDEAISYGNRRIIKLILRSGRKQARHTMNERRSQVIEALKLIKDFEMELKWEFYSWVPLVKRFLPSDTCHISKKGSLIRLDTTLMDFSDRNWQRGNLTFLFLGDRKPSQALFILDNDLKVYKNIHYNKSPDIEEDIDLLMSNDIVYLQMSTKAITFSRKQSGWFFSRYNKTEKVGQFEADFYNINGFTVETKKRREHLSEEDVQFNKQLFEMLKQPLDNPKESSQLAGSDPSMVESNRGTEENSSRSSSSSSLNDCDGQEGADASDDEAVVDLEMDPVYKRRKSLQPPSAVAVSWDDYANAEAGLPPSLGRPVKSKNSTRTFKATLAMSEEFPLPIEAILSVLEVIAPFKHFNKLRDFIRLNLPPGFPVKIDIPILPTVLARVTFSKFQFNDNISDSLFEIGCDYTEDSDRFPHI